MTAEKPTEVGRIDLSDSVEFEAEVANQLAVERLLRDLSVEKVGFRWELEDYLDSIVEDLEQGREPSPDDVLVARFYLKELRDDLEVLALLFGWNRADVGVGWGELTSEEKRDYGGDRD